jgi:hypothetical protein
MRASVFQRLSTSSVPFPGGSVQGRSVHGFGCRGCKCEGSGLRSVGYLECRAFGVKGVPLSRLGLRCWWFTVCGLGFRRVQGLGFRVEGLEVRG